MSESVFVTFWFDIFSTDISFQTLKAVLNNFPVPCNSSKKYIAVEVFHEMFKYDPENLLVDMKFQDDISTGQLLDLLKDYWHPERMYAIDTCYDAWCWSYHEKKFIPSTSLVTIKCCNEEFWGGYYREVGHIQLCFSDAEIFNPAILKSTAQLVLRAIKRRKFDKVYIKENYLAQPEDFLLFETNPEYRNKFIQNAETCLGIICRSITASNPRHTLCSLGGDSNPIFCSFVYHREIKDFLWDVEKILQFHKIGGYYIDDKMPREPFSYRGKYDLHLSRDKYKAQELSNKLDHYLNKLGTVELSKKSISDGVMMDVLSSCLEVQFSTLGEGWFLRHLDFPFSCIEEPYLRLLDVLLK